MKITTTKKDFISNTTNLFELVKKTNIEGVLAILKLNQLTFLSVSEKAMLRTTLQVDGGDSGVMVLPYAVFEGLKKNKTKTGQVELTHNNDEIEVTFNNETSKIKTITAQEWKTSAEAVITSFSEVPQMSFSMSSSTLNKMIDMVSFATTTLDYRKSLTGILMEGTADGTISMAAGDGFRVSIATTSVKEAWSFRVIIPKKLLQEAQNFLVAGETIGIAFTPGKFIEFTTPTTKLHGKLIDEVYPEFKSKLPTPITEPVKVELSNLFKPVKELVKEKPKYISFFLNSNNKVQLQGQQDLEKTGIAVSPVKDIGCSYAGNLPINIGLSPAHVMDFVSTNTEGDVYMYITDPTTPVRFDYTYKHDADAPIHNIYVATLVRT